MHKNIIFCQVHPLSIGIEFRKFNALGSSLLRCDATCDSMSFVLETDRNEMMLLLWSIMFKAFSGLKK